MLSIRKRAGRWYVRGRVKVGKETAYVAEHSAGTTDRAIAESYRAKLQRDTETELLHGTKAVRRQVTYDEAALDYLAGATRHLSDVSRVRSLTKHFAGMRLSDVDQAAFDAFCREEMPAAKAETRKRARGVLAAICQTAGVELPKIRITGKSREIIAWLKIDDADRLLSSYPKHVQPIAITACYCGLRASELTQLTIANVDMARKPNGAIFVKNPKNGRDRVVPMHPRVKAALEPLLHDKEGNPRASSDRLFLNRYGRPYADTRMTGGNPLKASHKAACKAAGVTGFRWHDWRHHFASWALRPISEGGAGMDVVTLKNVGGWSSLDQIQRYSHSSYELAAEGLSRRA
jgi:integrase